MESNGLLGFAAGAGRVVGTAGRAGAIVDELGVLTGIAGLAFMLFTIAADAAFCNVGLAVALTKALCAAGSFVI